MVLLAIVSLFGCVKKTKLNESKGLKRVERIGHEKYEFVFFNDSSSSSAFKGYFNRKLILSEELVGDKKYRLLYTDVVSEDFNTKFQTGNLIFSEYILSLRMLGKPNNFPWIDRNMNLRDSTRFNLLIDSLMRENFSITLTQNEKKNLLFYLIN